MPSVTQALLQCAGLSSLVLPQNAKLAPSAEEWSSFGRRLTQLDVVQVRDIQSLLESPSEMPALADLTLTVWGEKGLTLLTVCRRHDFRRCAT